MPDVATTRKGYICVAIAAVLLGATSPAFAEGLPLRLGISSSPPNPVQLPIYVARDKNFFKEEGLDVTFLNFAGGPTTQRALLSGDVEVVDLPPTDLIGAVSRGAPMKGISGLAASLPLVLVANQTIGSIKDLTGKSVAVSAPGSVTYHVTRIILAKHGVDVAGVKYLAMGSDTARYQSLIAGKADATLLFVTRAIQAQTQPTLHWLGDVTQELPNFPLLYFVSTDTVIKERADVLKRFVRAEIKATRWILGHQDEAATLAMTVIPNVSQDVMRRSIQMLVKWKTWSPNLALDIEAANATHRLALESKIIERPIPMKAYLTSIITTEALTELESGH
jgi:NitT/TauT family transport system substrate-binding protein